MSLIRNTAMLVVALCFACPARAAESIARVWNEEIIEAIRIDLPHPPVHARNLFHLSVGMYDAWAAYDAQAIGYLYHRKHTTTDPAAARHQAISYAAYRILAERYTLSRNATNTLERLAARMAALGYSTNNTSLDPSTPAGVGNSVAAVVSSYFFQDGSWQTNGYHDPPYNQGGYQALNPPLITGISGTLAIDINRWQPLAITNAVSQNGLPADVIQRFLGAQWLGVRPFAMARTHPTTPWLDPGPQPRLNGSGNARFRSEVVEVIRRSSELTPDDGVMIDISPGAIGNNSLGTNDGAGHPLNPVTGQPYAPNMVRRGDFARVLAEFWADGPHSETPPGHWNVLANELADHPALVKRMGGTGPVLDDLEWDVKLYFALNAALHDAACAAWALKRYYDGGRPVSFIRYMGQRGQSSDSQSSSYHPDGLPLVPGLIELVTAETAQPGQRHFGFPSGTVVILSWPGQTVNGAAQHNGVKWIRPATWLPYQQTNFVTPAFPGYISGHSTFSRAAAEVLAAMTGSAFFPGGLGTFTAPAESFLLVERGPSVALELQWATYYDAADQAGISRLWGGIHVPVDDFVGRHVGAQCGRSAWELARAYFDGSVTNDPPLLAMRRLDANSFELRFATLRGMLYKMQSSSDLNQPFEDEAPGFTRAVDGETSRVENSAGPARFFRVVRALAP